jgi:hypothetical protein
MPQFIHLTDSKKVARIGRAGIRAARTRLESVKGFYCTPVCPDLFRTYQWLRELKRDGTKSLHAIQFRLAPNTLVWVGRFNGEHTLVTTTEALKIFNQHKDALGLEIIVPHSLPRTSFTRVFVPSQTWGWRFAPEFKGRKPFCGLKEYNRGQINAYRATTQSASEVKLRAKEIRFNRRHYRLHVRATFAAQQALSQQQGV